ncbi:MAG: hypothetical protein U0S76_08015 [Pseudoxanthomonas sp.]|nr:hypothetical protein [Pseudoxanthomonas sp.]
MVVILDRQSKLQIDVEVPVNVGDALRRQLKVCQRRVAGDFGDRLAPLFAKALVSAMDEQCKPPTERDIRLAASVSAKSGVPITQEMWSSREMLKAFIEEHS